jgi:hypothetical protein
MRSRRRLRTAADTLITDHPLEGGSHHIGANAELFARAIIQCMRASPAERVRRPASPV